MNDDEGVGDAVDENSDCDGGEQIDERIHELGAFADTDWSQRTIVEIAAPTKTQGWFLHAMTGHEWLVSLVFRVRKNAFKKADLDRRLGLPSVQDTPGIEMDLFGDRERIRVANRAGAWQEVAVLGFKLAELDTPAFRKFLKEAVASFRYGR